MSFYLEFLLLEKSKNGKKNVLRIEAFSQREREREEDGRKHGVERERKSDKSGRK